MYKIFIFCKIMNSYNESFYGARYAKIVYFGHSVSVQSDQGLHYPLTKLLDTTKCTNHRKNKCLDDTLRMCRLL